MNSVVELRDYGVEVTVFRFRESLNMVRIATMPTAIHADFASGKSSLGGLLLIAEVGARRLVLENDVIKIRGERVARAWVAVSPFNRNLTIHPLKGSLGTYSFRSKR